MSSRPGEAPSVPAGLCERCVHRRIIESDRGGRFNRCGLADTDPRFPRYPRLPVIACAGFADRDATKDPGSPIDDEGRDIP